MIKNWLWGFIMLQLIMPVQAMAERPVVLELFTSQGCSSCPPADALMSEMAKDPSLLVLSFHIDYWDYLGWKDPYALSQGTSRQSTYAANIARGQVFTPQLIVDGKSSVVGSNRRDIVDAIVNAKNNISEEAGISFSPVTSEKIAIAVSNVPAESEIWLIYFSRQADTHVTAGENGGRRLHSTNIVTES